MRSRSRRRRRGRFVLVAASSDDPFQQRERLLRWVAEGLLSLVSSPGDVIPHVAERARLSASRYRFQAARRLCWGDATGPFVINCFHLLAGCSAQYRLMRFSPCSRRSACGRLVRLAGHPTCSVAVRIDLAIVDFDVPPDIWDVDAGSKCSRRRRRRRRIVVDTSEVLAPCCASLCACCRFQMISLMKFFSPKIWSSMTLT